MTRLILSKATLWVMGLMLVFLTLLSLAAASLIWNDHQATLVESEAQATRFVSGAEAALNRSLLGVDVLLASMDELLGLSELMARWVNAEAAGRVIRAAMQQNLMVRSVALVDAQGRVMASSDRSGTDPALDLPAGFVDEVLAQPISTLLTSAPVVNFASSDRMLYFARSIKLADGSKVAAVAGVPVQFLSSIMVQGTDISGLEVTLERSNGQLLASAPTQEQMLGKLLLPALGQPHESAKLPRLSARLSGAPAIVVTRPVLYRDLLIAASIPLDSTLQYWRLQRNFIVGVALLFAFLLVTAGGFAIWHFDRLTQARRSLAQSKASLDQALESMVSGFVLLNADHQLVRWNQRFVEIFPWLAPLLIPLLPFRQVLEATAAHHLPGASDWELHNWVARRLTLLFNPQAPHEETLPNGSFIQVSERRTPDGGVVIVYHDVTELHAASAVIENLAFYDPLTHLPNRRLLMDRLQQAIAIGARSGRYGAVLFLDLDNFKTLNDSVGHSIGDLLLEQVAQRLKDCVRVEDTVARLGGDEFVVVLDGLSERSDEAAALTRRIGEKILEQLNLVYQLAEHSHHSSASIGATLFSKLPTTPEELLKQADIAMYEVKSSGRNSLCFFDPQMQATISARVQLEADLRAALLTNQFELYYQPQFDLDKGVVGAEVLIRWHHPLRGLVLPGDFIRVAEESQLIVSIGQWVLRRSCQQLAVWQQGAPGSKLHLCVNVSARQFHQRDFVAQVLTVLHETGARPQLLKLELTESLVLDNVYETIAKMTELKAAGVRFSVDDFGTGHSSLAYLTQLPLDQLKIDQTFVRNIGIKPSNGVIVQTVIGMARNLSLEVIAEGVETREQQEFLAAQGCTLYQGYLFGKPTPLAQFEALLTSALPCTPN